MQLADPAVAQTEIDSGGHGNRAWHRWSRPVEYLRMVAAAWCVSMLAVYQLLIAPIDDDVFDVRSTASSGPTTINAGSNATSPDGVVAPLSPPAA